MTGAPNTFLSNKSPGTSLSLSLFLVLPYRVKCPQLPKTQPSHNQLGSTLHTVTKLPLLTTCFPGLFLPSNYQIYFSSLICERETKLIALILTKVYMTDVHCNILPKQEVYGFNLKEYSVVISQSIICCLF